MLIKVTVITESSEEYVKQMTDDTYEVAVAAAAQNGHANRAAAYLLSRHFGARAALVSGGTRSNKVFRIDSTAAPQTGVH